MKIESNIISKIIYKLSMKTKEMKVYLLVIGIAAVSLAGTAYAMQTEPGKSIATDDDKCAHGRNSFDCKPNQLRADIIDLQERVSALEEIHKNSP